jgi:hypothetical protein
LHTTGILTFRRSYVFLIVYQRKQKKAFNEGFSLMVLREQVETELVLASGQLHYCDTLRDSSIPFKGKKMAECF